MLLLYPSNLPKHLFNELPIAPTGSARAFISSCIAALSCRSCSLSWTRDSQNAIPVIYLYVIF